MSHNKQQIIMIGGLMGAGKTTLAKLIKSKAEAKGLSVEMLKFADAIYAIQSLVYGLIEMQPIKNRRLLQEIGDVIRDNVSETYFVEALRIAIGKSAADLVIVDDVRFQIELDLAKQLGAQTIFVNTPIDLRRERLEKLGTWSPSGHKTEAGIPANQFDIVFNNDGIDLQIDAKGVTL